MNSTLKSPPFLTLQSPFPLPFMSLCSNARADNHFTDQAGKQESLRNAD